MVGTYVATLVVCGSALLVGQAVLVVCGWRRWSWLAPVVGLGPVMALAWGTVQLPGEGTIALAELAVVSALALVVVAGRVDRGRGAIREGLPAALIALAAGSIPFLVEGRFGILGTGFNVDMSQHLFASEWLRDPTGSEPGLVRQGYPLGPHGLAVAAAELDGGNVVHGFGGLTVAVPVLAALTSLTVLRELPAVRRTIGATLVALPYIVASYLAQGQFKELLQGLFLLGFALCMHELARGWAAGGPPRRLLAAVPLAAIALGSLYSYSAPGLAWLAAAGILFAGVELARRRDRGKAIAAARRATLPVAIGVVVLLAGAAPELSRVVDFQGNAAEVADAGDPEPAGAGRVVRDEDPENRGAAGEDGNQRRDGRGERGFNDDLGNLFDDISPLEALGIWPSGDFRVEPGGGAAPAALFLAGALLAAVVLLVALRRWLRRGETAVPAALVAAIVIYLAAWAVSTPYAAAKAVMMIGPLAMLIAVREVLSPAVLNPAARSAHGIAAVAVAAAFVLGAGGSSLLALGNAPVGPDEYSPGLARMRSIFEGEPTLVLADRDELADEHARDFLGWEARGGDPLCIESADAASGERLIEGIRYVVTTGGEQAAPFDGLSRVRAEGPYAVWKAPPSEPRAVIAAESLDPGDPTECGLFPSA